MYFAYVSYVAIKDQTQFTFSFPIQDASELKVSVNGWPKVDGSDINFANGVITFTNQMLGGETVVIKRTTDISQRKVDFSDTALLTEAELDASVTQLFHAVQELNDRLTRIGG